MIESQQYKIGFFVIIAIIIVIVSLFLVGLNQLFEPTLPAITDFEESVQGLETGSPVKLRGVTVGKVTGIRISPSGDKITVSMSIRLNVFESYNESFDAYHYFNNEILKGLRCQVDYLGITGLKYVEMDYYPDVIETNERPITPSHKTYDMLHIPSRKSLVTGLKTSVVDLITSAQTAINNFNQLDFSRYNDVADESIVMVQDVRAFLNTRESKIDTFLGSIEAASNQVNKLAAQIQEYTDSRSVTPMMTDIRNFSTRTTELVDEIRATLKSMNLPQRANTVDSTLHTVGDAAQAFIQLRQDMNELSETTQQTLQRLNNVLRLLEENPSSIIRGEKGKSYFPERKE